MAIKRWSINIVDKTTIPYLPKLKNEQRKPSTVSIYKFLGRVGSLSLKIAHYYCFRDILCKDGIAHIS
jgi:hypothetical protein